MAAADSQPPPSTPPGRLVGIDFGTVRIGVAISDPGQTIASPYATYQRRGAEADARYFRRLVEEEAIAALVVGLPLHLSGQESEKSREVRRFAHWLEQVTGRKVHLFDERFSTAFAEQSLRDASLTRKRRDQRRDMLAAQVILASYLESQRGSRPDAGALDDLP